LTRLSAQLRYSGSLGSLNLSQFTVHRLQAVIPTHTPPPPCTCTCTCHPCWLGNLVALENIPPSFPGFPHHLSLLLLLLTPSSPPPSPSLSLSLPLFLSSSLPLSPFFPFKRCHRRLFSFLTLTFVGKNPRALKLRLKIAPPISPPLAGRSALSGP